MTLKEAHESRGHERPVSQDAQSWPSAPYPGDLSRRIAQRRAELKLTREQVAARANVTVRYLEFLEKYPGIPTGAVLRQLAAALQTSPVALLGAGTEVPPGRRRQILAHALERIPAAECHQLISAGGIGRIGFTTASGVVILPVNFAVAANTIVVRTDMGSIIAAHADGEVSFEVDHIDEALERAWSVLIQGPAHRVLQRTELAHLQRCADVLPWPQGDRNAYIRITARRISGRRIRPLEGSSY